MTFVKKKKLFSQSTIYNNYSFQSNPRTYRRGGGVVATPPKVFLFFFLHNKTSASEVFCGGSSIPCTHFETSLLMVSYYGYEII